jgi:hypothetical protein
MREEVPFLPRFPDADKVAAEEISKPFPPWKCDPAASRTAFPEMREEVPA